MRAKCAEKFYTTTLTFIDHAHQVEDGKTRARFEKMAWFNTPRCSTWSIIASDWIKVVWENLTRLLFARLRALFILIVCKHWFKRGVRSNPSNPPGYGPVLGMCSHSSNVDLRNSFKLMTTKASQPQDINFLMFLLYWHVAVTCRKKLWPLFQI